MKKVIVAGVLNLTLLVGCSLAPHYTRPAIPPAPAWPDTAAAEVSTATPASDVGWREFFGSLPLQDLIQSALEHNRDLRVAALSVEQIAAFYRIERTALLPTLDVLAAGARARTPGDLNPTGNPIVAGSYRVGLSVSSYELDLFGRVASLRDQVLEEYLATAEARRATQLTLVGNVAAQYLIVLALEEQDAVARQTLAASQASFDLRQRTFAAGTTSELDLRTAEGQVQVARATLAAADQQRALALDALTVLVGGELPATFSTRGPIESAALNPSIPAGLPSDLLERRPDILRAEHLLKSANANIGVARAAFFPSIKLTAFGGTSSAELAGLFGGGSKTWSFTPEIRMPIFAAGRNRATLDVARLQKQIEIANYEKTIQTAFREVADSLASGPLLEEQVGAQTARVAAAQKRFDLTELRYRSGVDNYLAVLLAQQELFAARQSLISARLSRDTNLISLYKALGGGWREN